MAATVPLKFGAWDADDTRMRGDRRSWWVALVGTLVALVLTGGVMGAVAVGPAPAGDRTVRAAGAGASGLAADAPSTTSTVAPAPVSTTVPSPLTAAAPAKSTTPTSQRPAATTVTTRPVAAPAPASGPNVRSTWANLTPTFPSYAVEVPFSPGRTQWSGVSNGVNIAVRVDKAFPKAGELITFDFEFTSTQQPCCNSIWLLYGDGYTHSDQMSNTCPTKPGPARFHTTHTYNFDGRWTLGVSPGGSCGAPHIETLLFFTLEISPGATSAQGPLLPHVHIDSSVIVPGHEDDPSWVTMAGQIVDDDGWLRSVVLDWGDGSPQQSYSSMITPHCTTWPSGWPAPSRQIIATGQAIHHYTAPGTYTVTVTAVSTACDGVSARQTGTGTYVWRIPA